MKTGKVHVGRQGVSLLEGQCTHDNPTPSFIRLILFMLSTRLLAWWGKHIGPLAFEINLVFGSISKDTWQALWCSSVMVPKGVLWLPLRPFQTPKAKMVINRETTALFTNSRAPIEIPTVSPRPASLSALQLCCSLGLKPELHSFWMSLVPVRDCKVGWEDSLTHKSLLKLMNILENN